MSNFKILFMPGPEESRTPYPLLAKQTLYQMSYRPPNFCVAKVISNYKFQIIFPPLRKNGGP